VIEHTFFVEVDRSEEGRIVLSERAHCYGTFYRDGGLAVRNGRLREEYKQFAFRVLVVCKTEVRRNNLAAKLLLNDPPVHTHLWLTTLSEIGREPLGAIWVRPMDYRDITVGTPYDPYSGVHRGIYRRQAEREEFVEQNIPKHALFK